MPEDAAAVAVPLDEEDFVRAFALDLLEQVWLSIDHESMQVSRRMGLWEELVGRLRSAGRAATLTGFVEVLARKLGITALRVDVGGVLDSMPAADALAALHLFRREPLVLVAELRARRDAAKTEGRRCSRRTPRS